MRATGLVLITLATLLLTIGDAAADWCVTYGGKLGGSESCGFASYEACRAQASGIGGFCRPNPFVGSAYGTARTWSSSAQRRWRD